MTKYTIYIPKYIADESGNPAVRADHIVQSIVEEIVHECGGATTVDGNGWWKYNGDVIREPVVVCTVCSDNFNYKRIIASIQLQLNQRSVFITAEDCSVKE